RPTPRFTRCCAPIPASPVRTRTWRRYRSCEASPRPPGTTTARLLRSIQRTSSRVCSWRDCTSRRFATIGPRRLCATKRARSRPHRPASPKASNGTGSWPTRAESGAEMGLRILHAIHDFLPRHLAGSEIYAYELARELALNHDVSILTSEFDATAPHGAI